ncbi:MAG: hypothetical protein KGS61_04735 [Verrucomicrobia bacterium]|nr:hypothetical protein [Verrucomicrobiota bacterium]
MKTRSQIRSGSAARAAVLLVAVGAGVLTPTPSSRAQTVTPTLVYSSFFGGLGYEEGYGIARDTSGAIYLVGTTSDTSGLTVPFNRLGPTWPEGGPNGGTYVVKYDPGRNSLAYVAFIPTFSGRAIAVDSSGSAYVAGWTSYDYSAGFTTNAFQAAYGGGNADAFVAKLSPAGDRLIYCTLLGGADYDMAQRIAVDTAGQPIVVGLTSSTNFPTTSSVVQPQLAGVFNAFITKLDASGSNLVFSTYLGGDLLDYGAGLALDAAGSIYVCGMSMSTNFASAPKPTRLGTNGSSSAFVAKLAPDAKAVQYLTLFGGSGNDNVGSAVAVDSLGNACVFGLTSSTDFPVTAQALQPGYAAQVDAPNNFLVKLGPAGSNFVYATYLGECAQLEYIGPWPYPVGLLPMADLALDGTGNAYAVGQAQCGNLIPGLTNANAAGYGDNGFLVKVNASGSAALYLRFFGPGTASGVALDGNGGVYITGSALYAHQPPYFPVTPGAFQTKLGADADGYLAKISETAPLASNDRFADRALLSGSRLTIQTDNTAATKEPGEPDHAGNPGGKSLWWSWTAPVDGYVSLTTDFSSFDTLLAIYTGTNLASLQVVSSNAASPSAVRFPVTAGTAYQIAVDGQDGASGSLSLSLTFSAPSNDDFANRIFITGFPASVTGSNIDATLEPGEDSIQGESHLAWEGSRSVWWSWTSPVTGQVELTTEGSSFQNVLAVYTGDAFTNLTAVAPPSLGMTSVVTFLAAAGTNYQIAVNGVGASSGIIHLGIGSTNPPPNDDFTNRTVLSGALIQVTNFNCSATAEPVEPAIADPWGAGKTLWWTWTAPANGRLKLDTIGSGFQTRLGVFIGSTLSNLTLVAASADYFGPRLEFEVTSNTVYNIVGDGTVGSPCGQLVLNLFFYQPPKISVQSLWWSLGTPFRFHVTGVTGRPYQIEMSPDLANWAPASTNTLLGPDFDFTDSSNNGARQRFYRAVEAH